MYCERYKQLKSILLEHPAGCTKMQLFNAISDYALSKDAYQMLKRDLQKLRSMGYTINSLNNNPGGKYRIRGVPEESSLPEY